MNPAKQPEFDMKQLIDEARAINIANVEAYRQGQKYVELQHRTTMRGIASAYNMALDDPKTVIPTALHAMLEAVRREVNGYPPQVVPPANV